MVFQVVTIRKWQNVLVWQNEMKSYYAYLPAMFVNKDIGLFRTEISYELLERYDFPVKTEKGGYVFKMSTGVAVMQAPFFAIAHIIALCGNDAEDGYSEPYRVLVMVSAIFYAFFGLFFIRKTLIKFFSEQATSLVLITLFLGTNLYFYTLYEGAMSHVYSFFLVSVFVYLTVSWHNQPNGRQLLFTAFVLGLITLIRPVNICLSIFFLLYRAANQETLKEKFTVLWTQWRYILIGIILFLFPIFLQLLYWKYTTGQFVYYSYRDESFFWTSPKIWLGLFSYQKGWLIWTPVMWFSVLGLLIMFLKKPLSRHATVIFITISLYIYIIFCWWCWWYGGGFGMRPMIDASPILAIPLAHFFGQLFRSKIWYYPVLGIWVFLLALNLFQTRQYVWGKLHWDGTSEKAYKLMFLNDYPKEDLSPYIQSPDPAEAIQGKSGLEKYK